MRHTMIKKIICSTLVFTIVFAASVFVFAEDKIELVNNMKAATLVLKTPNQIQINHNHEGFKAVVDKLVEEGKLSRDKADQIESFMKQKSEERKNLNEVEKQALRKDHKFGIVNELKNAKIITAAEAEAIRGKFRELKEQALNEKLENMLQQGSLTQAQVDKVKLYFQNARKERQEQFNKLQNMSEEQRKQFFKEHKKSNVIVKLVEDGVITKEQAKELRNIMLNGHRQ